MTEPPAKRGKRRTISPLPVAGFVIAVAVLRLFLSGDVNEEPWDLLIAAALLGLITAGIAKSRGRDSLLWWIYGTALFVVALPHALLLKPDVHAIEREGLASSDSRKCPLKVPVLRRDRKARGGGVPVLRERFAADHYHCLARARRVSLNVAVFSLLMSALQTVPVDG